MTVEVGDALVLTGDGWVDPYRELAAAHERAGAAGVGLGPVETATSVCAWSSTTARRSTPPLADPGGSRVEPREENARSG